MSSVFLVHKRKQHTAGILNCENIAVVLFIFLLDTFGDLIATRRKPMRHKIKMTWAVYNKKRQRYFWMVERGLKVGVGHCCLDFSVLSSIRDSPFLLIWETKVVIPWEVVSLFSVPLRQSHPQVYYFLFLNWSQHAVFKTLSNCLLFDAFVPHFVCSLCPCSEKSFSEAESKKAGVSIE